MHRKLFWMIVTPLAIAACATEEQKAQTLVTATQAAEVRVQKAAVAVQHKQADQDYSALFSLNQITGADGAAPSIAIAKRFLTANLALDGEMGTDLAVLQKQVLDLAQANATIRAAAEAKQKKSEAENAKLLAEKASAVTQLKKAINGEQAALISDAKQADEKAYYDSWFGLPGLIHYFTKTALTFIVISGIAIGLILIVRFFANKSPLAAAILALVERIAAVPLHLFAAIIPGAFHVAGWVVKEIEAEFAKEVAAFSSHGTVTPTNPPPPKGT